MRFDSGNVQVRNNLVDAAVAERSGNSFEQSNNVQYLGQAIFRDIAAADLRLIAGATGIVKSVPVLQQALFDIDGKARGAGSQLTDAGASELAGSGGTCIAR